MNLQTIIATLHNEFSDLYKFEVSVNHTGFVGLLTDDETNDQIVCMFDPNPLQLPSYKNNLNRVGYFQK